MAVTVFDVLGQADATFKQDVAVETATPVAIPAIEN